MYYTKLIEKVNFFLYDTNMEAQIWCPIARMVCDEGKLTISYDQSSGHPNATYKYTVDYMCKVWENGECLLYKFLKYLNESMEKAD